MTHSFARRNPSSSHCVQHCPSIRAPDWLPTITRTECGVRIHSPYPFQFPQFRILPNNQYLRTGQHRTISGGTERGGGPRTGGPQVDGCGRMRTGGPQAAGGGRVPVAGQRAREGGAQGSGGGERVDRMGSRQAGRSESRFQGGSAGAGWGSIGLPIRARKSPTLFRMGRGELGQTRGASFQS